MGPAGEHQEDRLGPHRGKEAHHCRMQLVGDHSATQTDLALCCHVVFFLFVRMTKQDPRIVTRFATLLSRDLLCQEKDKQD